MASVRDLKWKHFAGGENDRLARDLVFRAPVHRLKEPDDLAQVEQEGSEPGRQERGSASVQVQGQVLPGGRGRGNHSRHHPQTFLPPGKRLFY